DNVTLKDALKEIEKQSDFTFLYNDASINVNQTVTVSANELSIKELLDEVLDNKGIRYTIIDNQIVLTKAVDLMQENITISGQITDSESGEGLPGVTIVEKGTNNGTITDLDGNYSLSVAENASIIVSYVGYVTEEIPVGGQTSINLALIPDIISLDDVVVIGYGTVKKSDLTGAVASVSAEELQQSAVSGVDEALQGRTAGINVTSNSGSPGAAPSVRIRGIGTLTTPDPFFVIDGIPVSASEAGALNPGDIESIEILKDASAAAIYGARAANGVVLITTKKGKAGTSVVSFDAYTGVQSLAKKYELTNQREFITVRNELQSEENQENPDSLPSTDWQDEIFRKAKISNYQLSFLGGSENTQYALIGSYYNQEGIIKGTDYERYSIRLNTSSEIKPWLRVGENASYVFSNRNYVPEQDEYISVVVTALNMDPATPVYNEDGEPSAGIRNNIKNPVGALERDERLQISNKLLGNFFVEIQPVKWLTFRTTGGTELTRMKDNSFFREYNESSTYFLTENQLSRFNREYTTLIWENTLTFNKTFAEKHNFQVLAGYSTQSNKYRYNWLVSSNVPEEEDIRFISNAADPTSIVGADIAANLGGIDNPEPLIYDAYLISYLGRIMYNYGGLLDVHASIRRDGSSKFGEDNKWGIFPSFAAGFKLSELSFIKNLDFINFLKIRAGWGQLGNQEVGDYRAYTEIRDALNYNFGPGGEQVTQPGGAPTSIGNRDLKWEATEMTNFGLDFYMFDNKLGFNLDYFIRNTKDMLIEVPIPGLTGVQEAPLVNKGSLRNSGLELNATFKNKMGDFSYEVGGNIAFIKNEVTDLGSEDNYFQSGVFRASNYISRTAEGEPVASYYGYVTDGLWQTQAEIDQANQRARETAGDNSIYYDTEYTSPGDIKFKDINGDDRITSDDRTYIGNPNPDFTYGINIKLVYKIFDLVVFGYGVHGNEIFQSLIFYHESPNAYWNLSSDMLNHWTPENTNTTVPRLDQYNQNNNLRLSDRYVKDGSYFRIKNLQIGVSLPDNITDMLKIERLRIYFAAQNLLTFSKYTGYDPEIGTGGEVLDIGIDRGFYPIARSYMVGINLSF
ncbi:MAG: TonB-dependent receptor, partial [Bacteroidales bacterium]